MEKPCIVNIINFVRDVEPRNDKLDLKEPVINQLKLQKKYGFPTTFLLQYDTMLDDSFVSLFKNETNADIEIGLWLEMVQPLVESVGIKWNGRPGYSWDYHVNPDFLIAYHKEQRKLLIDEAMMQFLRLFGCYPKVVGSWLLDSYSMSYLSSAYKIDAFCICREQHGTDGYTLWGGYYNQGYYPSKYNMLHPAQSASASMKVPVFRMLGVDPIYEYDSGLSEEYMRSDIGKKIYTFEPIWQVGKDPKWIDWYFNDVVKNECMSMSYVQIGQENSFGWGNMQEGYLLQMEKLAELNEKGIVKIEKLGETGKWFRDNFKESPPTSMVAIEDWKNKGNQTAWYYNKNYRINFMTSKDKAWIRDIQLFYENYIDPHYVVPTAEETVKYDALPIIDGYLWSGNGKRSGIYLIDSDSGEYLKCRINNTRKVNDDLVLEAQINEKPVEIVFSDRTIEIVGYDMEFSWMWYAPEIENTEAWLEEDSRLLLKHNYYIYGLEGESITKGEEENTYIIKGNKLKFFFGS